MLLCLTKHLLTPLPWVPWVSLLHVFSLRKHITFITYLVLPRVSFARVFIMLVFKEEEDENSRWHMVELNVPKHQTSPNITQLYESLHGRKWRKWKMLFTKNLHNNPYTYSTRVIMEDFSRELFSFSSFLSIETLIKWSYFVDDPLSTHGAHTGGSLERGALM